MNGVEISESGAGLRRTVSPIQAGIVLGTFVLLLIGGYFLLQKNSHSPRAAAPQAMSAVVSETTSAAGAPDEIQPRPVNGRTHQDDLNQEKIENMKRGAMQSP